MGGFANSSQGQAQQQGVPPLNAFADIYDNGFNGAGPHTSAFIDVHNYQSIKLYVSDQNNGVVGSPHYRLVQVNWYSELNTAVPIHTEEFYVMDNGQVAAPLLTVLQPMIAEMPVRGWYMQVILNTNSPATATNIVTYSVIGQYKSVEKSIYSVQSGYFGISGASATGTMFDRLTILSGVKAAGGAQMFDYPPSKSGPASIHFTAANVTAAIGLLLVVDAATNLRLAGAAFPISANTAEADVFVQLPNRPIAFLIAPAAAGFATFQVSIKYDN